MSIIVSDKNKNRILKVINDEDMYIFFDSSFIKKALENLENNNELAEELAIEFLEKIYERGKSIRDIVNPNEEFEKKFTKAFENFDNIFKTNGYVSFKNDDFFEEKIIKKIEVCLELIELSDEYYTARDTRNVAKDAIDSIEYLKENNIEVSEETRTKLEEVKLNLMGLLEKEITDVESLKTGIDIYNEEAIEIWKSFLSDPSIKNGKDNYLIHNFTKGKVEGNFKDKYMSTSLITDNVMGTYGKSGFGYIINPKHIVIAEYKDTYTKNNSKDVNKITDIKTPIKLPQQIEEKTMKICESVNGEILNSDKESIYSEIVVDEYEIAGIYLITYGEKELNSHYKEAIEFSKEKGVPFKEIDITKKREEKGLEPLSEEMKKILCRKVLYSYCQNEQYKIPNINFSNHASSFINKNYEEFSDRFLKLKSKEEYTCEEIEKEFRNVVLDSIVKSEDKITIFSEDKILQYQGFFLGRVTNDEFEYIINNRYDFSKCKTLENFQNRYKEFKEVIVNEKYISDVNKKLDEMFVEKEVLKGKDLTDEELEQIFNLEDRSLNKIIEYLQERDKKDIEPIIFENDELIVPSIEEKVVELNTDEDIDIDKSVVNIDEFEEIVEEKIEFTTQPEIKNIEENEIYVNEFGEIIRENNAESKAEEVIEKANNVNNELTFMQKVAYLIATNKFLNKLTFIKKFSEKQLKMLPEARKEFKTVDTVDNLENNFIKNLKKLNIEEKDLITNSIEKDKEKTKQLNKNDFQI